MPDLLEMKWSRPDQKGYLREVGTERSAIPGQADRTCSILAGMRERPAIEAETAWLSTKIALGIS